MKLLKIVEAKYKSDYKIRFIFNNGESGIVDLEQKIKEDSRKIFKVLLDKSFFSDFYLNRWTIEWKNGLDLAPEYLYDLMVEQKNEKEHFQ